MRGDPHEVFRPREGGLTRIRCFSVVVVVVVAVVAGLQKPKNCQNLGKSTYMKGPANQKSSKKINFLENIHPGLDADDQVLKYNNPL